MSCPVCLFFSIQNLETILLGSTHLYCLFLRRVSIPSNYKPTDLSLVIAKVFEFITKSHFLNHLQNKKNIEIISVGSTRLDPFMISYPIQLAFFLQLRSTQLA